ncbi:hypothetical protein G6F22_019180 [Rhizopus arrhizus]|nr:hypothetical protein G6F22_019180 [Rhizopus arrhizus]
MCNRPVPLHRTAWTCAVTRMGRHAGSRPLVDAAARGITRRCHEALQDAYGGERKQGTGQGGTLLAVLLPRSRDPL